MKFQDSQRPGSRGRVDAVAEPIAAPDAVLAPGGLAVRSALRDYWTLTKPEISLLVMLSALAGYLVGQPGMPDYWTLVMLMIGVGMTSAGVGALNQYFERDLDARMRRTSQRPLPAGRLSPASAARFGYLLVIGGVGMLCPLTNPLTGVLAAVTVVLYLFVYTPLKLRTTLNTLVGTIPGALPALGGWTAATGGLGSGGWVFFGILAAWQMPHFLSLAWMYRKDYARAGMRMPAARGADRSTRIQTLFFTSILVPLGLLPWMLGLTGVVFALGSTLLGLGFLYPAARFAHAASSVTARHLLLASIAYIPMLLVVLIMDRLL